MKWGDVIPIGVIYRSNRKSFEEMTPALAAAYAVKTAKTLARDLHRLEELGLIERTAVGMRARTEIVQAMLPRRVP